jgi:hypothetical protein
MGAQARQKEKNFADVYLTLYNLLECFLWVVYRSVMYLNRSRVAQAV